MAYLLDTNHCIYLINGLDKKAEFRSESEKHVIGKVRSVKENIFMSEVTLGELYFGAAKSERKDYNFKRIKLFKLAIRSVQINDTIWKLFGETKATLRKQGKTLTDFDLLIACTARANDYILVTNDVNFDILRPVFQLENWTK